MIVTLFYINQEWILYIVKILLLDIIYKIVNAPIKFEIIRTIIEEAAKYPVVNAAARPSSASTGILPHA